jgi:hypothetical protein
MKKFRSSLGLLIGYHGCDRAVAEKILAGEDELRESTNSYDWLGPGVYFWIDNPLLAFGWAKNTALREPKKIKEPYVLGAYINPGICLNLADAQESAQLRLVYEDQGKFLKQLGLENTFDPETKEYIDRNLDCATIKLLHQLRFEKTEPAFDSVFGVFESGKPLFEGSALKSRTHMQIAVRTHNEHCNILGYFRPMDLFQKVVKGK